MEGETEFRPWDELVPEVLAMICSILSLKEVLTVIPMVCKSWNNAVKGPYCWQEIDIWNWSSCSVPDRVERMLQMLMNRSSGPLLKLCVSNLQDGSIFSTIAEKAGLLHTLRLKNCGMSDAAIEQIACSLSSVTFIDLSSCEKLSTRAIEAIGTHCQLLERFCWNMQRGGPDGTINDDACAIARTMPGLKHLELANNLISDEWVVEILFSCPELEFLDLRGCPNLELDMDVVAEEFPNLKVLWTEPVDSFLDDEFGFISVDLLKQSLDYAVCCCQDCPRR